MPLATNLIASREKHSITEAILSIFLLQPLIKPSRFKELLTEGHPLNNRFQHFQIQQSLNFSAEIGVNRELKPDLRSTTPQDMGFIMNAFKNGTPEYILTYQTNGPAHVISIHAMQYESWNLFIKDVSIFLNALAQFQQNIFFHTIGLTYIDQFNWLGEDELEMKMIFNENSSYLPPQILENKGEWNYTFGHTMNIPDKLLFEHINLGISTVANNNSLLTLSHNVARGFIENEKELNEKTITDDIIGEAEYLHTLNKLFLKSCLKEEILLMIGLN